MDSLKSEGNELFKNREYLAAADKYSAALDLCQTDTAEARSVAAILLCNRAACHLFLNNAEACVTDTTEALAFQPGYGKALFRRSQAFEKLGRVTEAFEDLQRLSKLEPGNKEVIAALRRLAASSDTQQQQQRSSSVRIKAIVDELRDAASGGDRGEKAIATLLAAAQEGRAAEVAECALPTVFDVLERLPAHPVRSGCLRLLRHLATAGDQKLLRRVAQEGGARRLLQLAERYASAGDEADVANCVALVAMLVTTADPPAERDHAVAALIKFVDEPKAGVPVTKASLSALVKLPWSGADATAFAAAHAGAVLSASLTDTLRPVVSMLIARLFAAVRETPDEDERFTALTSSLHAPLRRWLASSEPVDELRGLAALAALSVANLEASASIALEHLQDIVDAVEAIGNIQPDLLQAAQLAAAEATGNVAGHKKFREAADPKVLQELLELLASETVAVQAKLVSVVAKLSATHEAIREQFLRQSAEQGQPGSVERLLQALEDRQAAPNALEALCFVVQRPENKEKLAHDQAALKRLLKLTESIGPSVWYSVVAICDLITRYPIANSEEEQIKRQLADFASGQQKSLRKPEKHPLDDEPHIHARCAELIEAGVVGTLVTMFKQQPQFKAASEALREAVVQVLASLSVNPANRGKLVQLGAMKLLLPLSDRGGDRTRRLAAHAMARIAISVNPNVGYREGVVAQLATPLISLLRHETDDGGNSLEQFEALMALTNLVSIGDELGGRIAQVLHEKALKDIENLQLSTNELVQRAASELLCNLVMYDKVRDLYRGPAAEHRLKLWAALASSDDHATARAAAGALAVLSEEPEICQTIGQHVKLERFVELLSSGKPDLQHRAAEAVRNLAAEPGLAERLIAAGAPKPLQSIVQGSTAAADLKESASVALKLLQPASKRLT